MKLRCLSDLHLELSNRIKYKKLYTIPSGIDEICICYCDYVNNSLILL